MGRPSFWGDEAATISASTRSLPDLARLVSSVDAVHASYYLLMHGWFELAPPTESWSRVPGCLACGGAAAGVVVLTRLLADRPTALLAGVIFAVLPRTTWAATEARSFAFSALAAVWVTVVLVVAMRRNIASVWVLYSLLLCLSTVFFIFLALMIPVHCVVVLVHRAGRVAFAAFAAASLAAIASVTPFVLYTSHQVGQVNWIAKWTVPTPVMLFHQYFDNAVPVAGVAFLLVLAAVCVRPRPGLRSLVRPAGAPVAIAVAWMVLPTAVLLVYSAVAQPIYLDRYLTFSLPGMALLLAVSVRRLSRNRVQAAGLIALLAVAAVPNYVDQRDRYAKLGMDYSDVADLVKAHGAPGDCLLLDDTVTWEPAPLRAMVQSRPDAYVALIDIGAGQSASDAGMLWSIDSPLDQVLDRLANCNALWTLSFRDWTLPSYEAGAALPPGSRFGGTAAFLRPAEMGFHLVERWEFNENQVTRAIR
ncbi:MAG: putative rane protein [Mycobacterium sp.]|nr:putative rane protein [Mycobacterium sp.]